MFLQIFLNYFWVLYFLCYFGKSFAIEKRELKQFEIFETRISSNLKVIF